MGSLCFVDINTDKVTFLDSQRMLAGGYWHIEKHIKT